MLYVAKEQICTPARGAVGLIADVNVNSYKYFQLTWSWEYVPLLVLGCELQLFLLRGRLILWQHL